MSINNLEILLAADFIHCLDLFHLNLKLN